MDCSTKRNEDILDSQTPKGKEINYSYTFGDDVE
jgi:hypothetical protein